jgi:radical SAM superfamily enzyme YgiQ (UPF0313 family)
MKSLGAYKVASAIREMGYSCLVIDHYDSFSKEEFEKILKKTITSDTLFVGFSTTFLQNTNNSDDKNGKKNVSDIDDGIFFPQGKDFQSWAVSSIRQKNANCKIVVGGTRVHANYQTSDADFFVIGFSESSVPKLIDHIKNNNFLPKSFINNNNITVINDILASDYNISEDKSFKWEYTDVLNSKVLPIELSRGCIFKCSFCSFPFTGKKKLEFVKDPNVIKQELQESYDLFGINHFLIVDDTFNDSKEKINAIYEAIQELNFQPYFWAHLRLDLLSNDPDVFDTIYKIGVRYCLFGIETFNEKAGRAIKKGGNREKQKEMVRYIRKNYPDFVMHGSFIIGLPEESIESINQTMDDLCSGEVPLNSVSFNPLAIYKDNQFSWASDIEKNPEKYGYEFLDFDDDIKIKKDEYDIVDRVNIWKNKHMTFFDAVKLANHFVNVKSKKSKQKLTTNLHNVEYFHMINYGFSLKDLSVFQKNQYEDKDGFWALLSKKHDAFLKEHKKLLFAEIEKI